MLIHALEMLSILVLFSLLMYKNQKLIKLTNKFKLSSLYTDFQSILDISNADFIVLFYYDYNNRYITSNFQFLINKEGKIITHTKTEELPVTINPFSLQILNSDDSKIHEFYKNEMEGDPMSLREIYKNSFKMYYQNIIKCGKNPMGYIVLSYDHEYKLTNTENQKIMKVIKELVLNHCEK